MGATLCRECEGRKSCFCEVCVFAFCATAQGGETKNGAAEKKKAHRVNGRLF
jgi:hypothetical protein